jgi:glucose/arabinose dehydrogenase
MSRSGLTHSRVRALVVLIAAASLATPEIARAQLKTEVRVSGLSRPVAFIQDPSAPTRQYVVEQDGWIKVVENGTLQPTPFLDLTAEVSTGGERGLLGLAFAPDYGTSGRFWVNFTNRNGHTVIARFRRSTIEALRADPASRFDLMWPDGRRFIFQPFSNHNGGTLLFGTDGYLYIGMGDGGSGNDPDHLAQRPESLLGKMLRIDVNVSDADREGYDVPADNPFLDGQPVSAMGEIWAFGLRNPWKFSIDSRALGGTGALLIADVGQSGWEEINYEPEGRGGRNYGWRNREGAHEHRTSRPPAFQPLTDPIAEYPRSEGHAVTGGFVYRGRTLSREFVGRYFFADFSFGRVWSVALATRGDGESSAFDMREHTAELGGQATVGMISSFGVDAAGELYIVSWNRGEILSIGSTLPPPPLPPEPPPPSPSEPPPATLDPSYGPRRAPTPANPGL